MIEKREKEEGLLPQIRGERGAEERRGATATILGIHILDSPKLNSLFHIIRKTELHFNGPPIYKLYIQVLFELGL